MNKNRIVVANWKLNLNLEQTKNLAQEMVKKFTTFEHGKVAVCPTFVSLQEVKSIIKNSPLKLGAQAVFWENQGSFTGEISPEILAEVGCEYVIIGHSERRKYLLENYEMINKIVKTVVSMEKLTPIICIGENWDERKTDKVDFVLVDQLQQALGGVTALGDQEIIIAYEPIWAIGSGAAMEPGEAEYSHKIIKLALNGMYGMQVVNKNFRIIYGGSISSQNVKSFAEIDYLDGLLVGGASLDADEFVKVAKAIIK